MVSGMLFRSVCCSGPSSRSDVACGTERCVARTACTVLALRSIALLIVHCWSPTLRARGMGSKQGERSSPLHRMGGAVPSRQSAGTQHAQA
eukprot:COSAG02_NODE_5401_length_4361_cov_3.564054_3_plen_91_part_00